jgi:hypothetical protein
MFELARSRGWSRWADAEEAFLDAMWEFDAGFERGQATQGDNQNGKGDFFTDLICVLLEACSERTLSFRPRVPGLIFRENNLDAAYPPAGAVEVLIETKVAGAPKTSRNPSQQNPRGRRGSADLDKRVKEAGFKTIDLKAEWARVAGQGGGPGGDFVTWLRRSKPSCYLLLAVRVIDGADLRQAVRMAEAANQMMDGCGLVCYEPGAGRYRLREVPTALELDRVFSRICAQLRQFS